MGNRDIKETKIKELILRARGPHRNMQEFAKEIGMSPAKLYRIAQGGFRKPISDKDLSAIAEHADADSDVTFGLLKIAVMQDEEDKHPETIAAPDRDGTYWEISARRAVMEALFASNIAFVDAAREGQFFDFSMNAHLSDNERTLYFAATHMKAPYHIQRTLEESVGRFVLNADGHDAWHYIVFIAKSEELQAGIISSHMEYLRQYHTDFNISVLFIEELPDRRYAIREVCMRPEEQIFDFNYAE